MGARKANKAAQLKAEKKQKAIAIMRDCPTSPRKMRLVADIIRGVEINKACLLYTSPSPRDYAASRMPSSA